MSTGNSSNTNSITKLPIPFIGEINNRRFVTAILAGIIGGAGVSAAANLLRGYRALREKREGTDTDDSTIVLTLPSKTAADGYTSMRDAKPGEHKITTNGGRQFRDSGKYSASVGDTKQCKGDVKCASGFKGNPGPNSVGTVVANAIGLTAGGLLSYEVASRLFDAMHERRLRRKLEAAQQAYVKALSGESKRAELISRVLDPVEHVIMKQPLEKSAGPVGWLSDLLPDGATNMIRYPTAAYILALLAGTGATAYVTKKVMDREFPEGKLKKDINRPTRIVFRMDSGTPVLLEGDKGSEKKASADTCAAITAMLPIYMDIVEGAPNRTLSAPYTKIAEAAGTDAAGLMKLAQEDLTAAYRVILRDPGALWSILQATNFGLDFDMHRAAHAVRTQHPELFSRALGAVIDSKYKTHAGDSFFKRFRNNTAKSLTKFIRNTPFKDRFDTWAIDKLLQQKRAYISDILSPGNIGAVLTGAEKPKAQDTDDKTLDERDITAKAKKHLKRRRSVQVAAGDRAAAKYIKANEAKVRKVLARLSAQGII